MAVRKAEEEIYDLQWTESQRSEVRSAVHWSKMGKKKKKESRRKNPPAKMLEVH